MNNSTAPECLYHYTSIEALALILKNKTIRFSNLCNLNDKQEPKSADIQNYGRFIFVSCWSADESESISMWHMYAKTGVRIRLPCCPFAETEYTIRVRENDDIIKFASVLDETTLALCCQVPFENPITLEKIKYSDDKDKLYPTVGSFSEDSINLWYEHFGKCKSKMWEMENEFRYFLQLLPFDSRDYAVAFTTENSEIKALGLDKYQKQFDKFSVELLNGNASLPFEKIDINLFEESFSNIEITLSPFASSGTKVLIETLVEKYCPSANVIDSALKGLIRA